MSAQRHGHPPADPVRERPLLVVIDPLARRTDGESVRIAKDVLCAGASAKICLPDGPEELARAMTRRGRRRTVVVGDDDALLRVVGLLHRERTLGDTALSLVPIGASAAAVRLARALGVPTSPVEAARAVLDGAEQRLDLLVDDSDGVVLGGLRIPAPTTEEHHWPGAHAVWSMVRTLAGGKSAPHGSEMRHVGAAVRPSMPLRVEADGVLVADLDRPVRQVRVSADGGLAKVVVRCGPERDGPVYAVRATTVTVSGADFRYRTDTAVAGPVRTRTWTVRPGAWSLTLPRT